MLQHDGTSLTPCSLSHVLLWQFGQKQAYQTQPRISTALPLLFWRDRLGESSTTEVGRWNSAFLCEKAKLKYGGLNEKWHRKCQTLPGLAEQCFFCKLRRKERYIIVWWVSLALFAWRYGREEERIQITRSALHSCCGSTVHAWLSVGEVET